MSIKRLPPEAVETFSMVLHPKRRYSTRLVLIPPPTTFEDIITEAGELILTEGGEDIVTES